MGENDYDEYEDYDEEYREMMIKRFKYDGLDCTKGVRFWADKEIKENEKRMMEHAAEKGKNVVVVSDNESSQARVQQGYCSTSSAANWSPDSPLLIKPLAWRSSSTCCKVPVPLLWVPHPTKKRTAGTCLYHDQEITQKCQNVSCLRADEKPSTAREQPSCSSSSCEAKWSTDSPALFEPSDQKTSSMCYVASVLVNLGKQTTIPTAKETTALMEMKNRTTPMSDNMVQEQRTKKRKYVKIKTEEEHEHLKEERKKKITKTNSKPVPPPVGMPINLELTITELGGRALVWLTEKRLTLSDLSPNLGRLLFPSCGHMLEEYLTTEEKEKLVNRTDNSKGLKVLVVDTSGEQFDVDLRFWESVEKYVFARNWNKIVKRSRMEPESDTIQLWCFRLPPERGSKLCFAINIERGP